jgi:hypothetical protein
MERQFSQQRNRFHPKEGESMFWPKHRPLRARCHSSEQSRLAITQRRGQLSREDANKVPRNEKSLSETSDSRRGVNDIFAFGGILRGVSGENIDTNFKFQAIPKSRADKH